MRKGNIPVKKASKRAPKKKGHLSGLNTKEIETLNFRLIELKDELIRAIDEKASSVVRCDNESESVIKGDDAEVAEKQRINNSVLQELDILKSRLSLVQRALHKMKMGIYGICEESEEPIGFERLSAVPWARYSVDVQEKRELRQREYRRSSGRAISI